MAALRRRSDRPLVGLAVDWNLQWHHYRARALPRCDLILTDTHGVDVLHRAGLTHARAANLFGLGRSFLKTPAEPAERDIDVLFVGNLSPTVQRERLPWLGRLAALADRWRVHITQGVFGDEYHTLLRRARIVFNRSIRGECNQRAFEAAARGALLFQERGNVEVAAFFRDGQECVYYGDDDLEPLLEHYLIHEDERTALAQAGQTVALAKGTFAVLWAEAVRTFAAEWDQLTERARRR